MERVNGRYMYAVITLVIILFIILYTDKIDLTSDCDDSMYEDDSDDSEYSDESNESISDNEGYFGIEGLSKGRKKKSGGGGKKKKGKSHKNKKKKKKSKPHSSMCVIT